MTSICASGLESASKSMSVLFGCPRCTSPNACRAAACAGSPAVAAMPSNSAMSLSLPKVPKAVTAATRTSGLGDWFARAEARRPENGAAIAIGINLLQFAQAVALDKFSGTPEISAVFAPLLPARLIDPPIPADGGLDRLAFRDTDCGWFLAVYVLAGLRRHD